MYGNITYEGDKPEDVAKQFLEWKSSLKGETIMKRRVQRRYVGRKE